MIWFRVLSVCLCIAVTSAQWVVDPNTLPQKPNSEYTCRMWGDCYLDGSFWKTCAYNGAAPQLIRDGLTEDEIVIIKEFIEDRCPHMLYDEDGNRIPEDEIYACCAPEQIYYLHESMKPADGVLGRCPTCAKNFYRQICEMYCSPEQSRFMTVYNETSPEGIVYINEIDYRLHEDYMVNAHASCSGVLIPQTGLPAINLMCGSAPVCDPESWFGFSGDATTNPFVPVQVNFMRWFTLEDSMNAVALSCNETYEGDLPCSCVDCNANCPVGNEPVLPDICTVLSVNCLGFSLALVIFVVFTTIFIVLTLLDYRKMRESNKTETKENNDSANVNVFIKVLQVLFYRIGSFSADHPMLILLITTWVAFAMFFGFMNLNITANPLEIWSAPDSRSRMQLDYFNSRFGPFYRAAQVFLQMKGLSSFTHNNVTYGPAYRVEAIEELVALEDAILAIGRDTGRTVLEDVCFAPMLTHNVEKSLDLCTLMSITTYLGNDKYNLNNVTLSYLDKILNCQNNYLGLECMAPWGGGAEKEIVFGGYEADNVLEADTLLINLPLNNYLYKQDLQPTLDWETQFIELMLNYTDNWKSDFVDVSFACEKSIEDELEKVSRAEAVPIIVSYILMFIYVCLALGHIHSIKSFFVGSKVLVGFASIVIEIFAIFCALGMMGFIGVTATLLSLNVIPFFILSVGIDNVFLMVNTIHKIDSNLKQYDDYNDNFSFSEKRRFIFGKMMKDIGPSIFVTSLTQITCFTIGTTSKFPAVSSFAFSAAISLAFLFIFQITTIIAILSLDYWRISKRRLDVFVCIQTMKPENEDPLTSTTPHVSLTQRFMTPYSKFLLNWRTKIVVAILFIGWVSVSLILIPQLEIGLDQEMALPKDSYVYKYLNSVADLFKLGVPVFFVLKSGLNFSDPIHQNVICGGQLCNDDSLVTQVFLASQYSDITYMAKSSNSWLDDFFDWSGLRGSCCKYNIEDDSFCSSTNTSSVCTYCSINMDDNGLRPLGEAFDKYIPFFLQDVPTESCNKGGLASYAANVNYILDDEGKATVHDSNFMAYHVNLVTSQDYITAAKYGYEISDNITRAIKEHTGLDVEVFPYSVFYPFYEQYITMWEDTFTSLGFCILGVLVITLLATGFHFVMSFTLVFTSLMVVIDMMGMMYVWNIPLNPVSCINLIVSIGISIEFTSHLSYAFATSDKPYRERAAAALQAVGPTIITGITLTNIPIIVLAFSYTEVIEVFFFRMLFGLVIIGFFHGMVFYPVLLSFISNIINYRK